MSQFTRPAGSYTPTKSNGDDSNWVMYVKKQQPPMTVRFLTEPDQWLEFQESYDMGRKVYVPVPFDEEHDPKPAFRYLTAALLVDDDKARALKLPWSLGDALRNIHASVGTIMDRDFQLIVTGEGMNTTYLPYPSPEAFARPVDKYEMPDLEAAFEGYREFALAKLHGETTQQPAKQPAPAGVEEPPFDSSRVFTREELTGLAYDKLQQVVAAKGGSVPDNAPAAALVEEVMLRQNPPKTEIDVEAVRELKGLLDDSPSMLEDLGVDELADVLAQLGVQSTLKLKPALLKKIREVVNAA